MFSIYMLFTDWEVRITKNFAQGLRSQAVVLAFKTKGKVVLYMDLTRLVNNIDCFPQFLVYD